MSLLTIRKVIRLAWPKNQRKLNLLAALTNPSDYAFKTNCYVESGQEVTLRNLPLIKDIFEILYIIS
jgi:hypothetical protein